MATSHCALAKEEVLLEAGGGLPQAEVEAIIEASLRRGSLGLVEVARQARLAEPEKLLIVVDQFEELFRFRAARGSESTSDDASAFVKLLLEASQQREFSIYVVPTMRSDFLGDCAQFQGLPEAINDGQYLIPRMTRDERRVAITGPVGVTRGKITEPLVNRLMNDVGDNPDQLPILQHALMRTWNYWAAHRLNGDPIGLEHYEEIGTMSDALSLHADEAYEQLPEHLRPVCETIFKTLTERGADNREIRRPTRLKDICEIAGASAADVIAVIEVFRDVGCSFLMPPVGVELKPETVIDISHESLIRNWERLQAWVKDEAESARIYRRLAGAAQDYHQGAGGLLDDVTLQYALRWQERSKPSWHWGVRYHPDYNTAMAYLERSTLERDVRIEAEQERERRELSTARTFAEKQARAARRLRWLSAGMAVMFVLSLVAAGYALSERNKAKREKANAENSEKTAKENAALALKQKIIAEKLTGDLQKNYEALEAERTAKETEARRADARAREAEAEKARAEKKSREAEAATTLAVANAEEAKKTVERSFLIRDGLEALQRKEYTDAKQKFGDLVNLLERHSVGQRSLTPEQVAVERGWAHSNKGFAHWRAGELGHAHREYEEAEGMLERNLMDKKNPLFFETYYGLAHVYHEIASAGGIENDYGELEPQDVKKFFGMAETSYKKALAFQTAQKTPNGNERPEVADGYTDLARLYRDMGRIEDAERNFAQAVESRLKFRFNDAAVSALKEQGEFFRTQGRLDDAAKVYNRLIPLQEKQQDLARGRDLADTYNELGQIQAAKGDASSAADAYRVASLLERVASKVKLRERFQSPPDEETSSRGLATDLDALGDAYVALGKFPLGEAAYESALDLRAKDKTQLPKSYEKLAALYQRQKNYAKADENYNLLLNLYSDKPGSVAYAAALFKVAAFYAAIPDRSSDAVSKYNQARTIFREKGAWFDENLILFRLTKLYEKQGKDPERAAALRERADTLAGYVEQLVAGKQLRPNDPTKLVSEYLFAVDAFGYFRQGKNDPEVEAAYHRAFQAREYITNKIRDEKVLKFYVAVLSDYQAVLNNLPAKKTLAAEVGGVAQGFRVKLSKDEESKLTRESRTAAAQ